MAARASVCVGVLNSTRSYCSSLFMMSVMFPSAVSLYVCVCVMCRVTWRVGGDCCGLKINSSKRNNNTLLKHFYRLLHFLCIKHIPKHITCPAETPFRDKHTQKHASASLRAAAYASASCSAMMARMWSRMMAAMSAACAVIKTNSYESWVVSSAMISENWLELPPQRQMSL